MAAEITPRINDEGLKNEIIQNINRFFTKPEVSEGEYDSNNNMYNALHNPRDYNTHFEN